MVHLAESLTAEELKPMMTCLIEPIYRIVESPEMEDEQTSKYFITNFDPLM